MPSSTPLTFSVGSDRCCSWSCIIRNATWPHGASRGTLAMSFIHSTTKRKPPRYTGRYSAVRFEEIFRCC
jgi:hypothetical protein